MIIDSLLNSYNVSKDHLFHCPCSIDTHNEYDENPDSKYFNETLWLEQ